MQNKLLYRLKAMMMLLWMPYMSPSSRLHYFDHVSLVRTSWHHALFDREVEEVLVCIT